MKFDSVRDCLTFQGEVLSTLEDRLGLVMNPALPDGDGAREDGIAPALAPCVEMFIGIEQAVCHHTARLQIILQRLAL